MKSTNNLKRTIFAALALTVFGMAGAATSVSTQQPSPAVAAPAEVQKNINALVDGRAKIKSVKLMENAGLYEVVIDNSIVYVTPNGKYFVNGNLFRFTGDKTNPAENLTEQRMEDITKMTPERMTEIRQHAKTDAMITVKGTGSRTMYIFSDPDCPYCKQLQSELDKPVLDNVTIYTFYFPIAQIHPNSIKHASDIWCASVHGGEEKRREVWDAALVKNIYPKDGSDCNNPVQKNIEFGQNLGIMGTPYIIYDDGRVTPGSAPVEQINEKLGK